MKVKSTAFPPVSSAEVPVPVVPAVAGDGRGQHLDVGQHHETQEGRGGRRYSECCDNQYSTCDGSRGEVGCGGAVLEMVRCGSSCSVQYRGCGQVIGYRRIIQYS